MKVRRIPRALAEGSGRALSLTPRRFFGGEISTDYSVAHGSQCTARIPLPGSQGPSRPVRFKSSLIGVKPTRSYE